MVNGVIYFVMSWFGILAFIQSIVNQATIGPIVLFVGESFCCLKCVEQLHYACLSSIVICVLRLFFQTGLAINEECLNFIPSRHYAAYL